MNDIKQTAIKTIISTAITSAVAVGVTFIVLYFTQLSHSVRILALEETSVRKDVLTETLEPMKEATIRIEEKLDRLIERNLK